MGLFELVVSRGKVHAPPRLSRRSASRTGQEPAKPLSTGDLHIRRAFAPERIPLDTLRFFLHWRMSAAENRCPLFRDMR